MKVYNFDIFKQFYFFLKKKLKTCYKNKKIYDFKKLLERKNFAKNLIFYRGDGQLSLFETVLRSNECGSSQFISLIWVVYKLWEDDTILNQVCAQNKKTTDYKQLFSATF